MYITWYCIEREVFSELVKNGGLPALFRHAEEATQALARDMSRLRIPAELRYGGLFQGIAFRIVSENPAVLWQLPEKLSGFCRKLPPAEFHEPEE